MRNSREEMMKAVMEYVNESLTGIKVEQTKNEECHVEYRLIYIPFGNPFKTRFTLTKETIDLTGTEQDPGVYIFAQDIATICFEMDDELKCVDIVMVREMAEV